MYTAYFGFREEPFSLTPTSRLFYTNPVYEETYTKLLEGIYKRKGFLVLTGEVGTGKTTLLRRLMNTLDADSTVSMVFSSYSVLTFAELLSFICAELGLGDNEEEHASETHVFSEFLLSQSQKGGITALLIDEAQDLEEEVLENLFPLSYCQPGGKTLLQVILVGQQPELEEKLNQRRLRPLKQRIAVHRQLERLKTTEVNAFIHHRLRLVGYERQDLFCAEAIQLIARYSTGIPRLVNLLCDNALQATYAAAQKTVSAEVIQKVATHLRLKQESTVVQLETLRVETLADGGTDDAPEGANRPSQRTSERIVGGKKRIPGEALQLVNAKFRRRIPRLLAWSTGAGVVLALLGLIVLNSRVIEREQVQGLSTQRMLTELNPQQRKPAEEQPGARTNETEMGSAPLVVSPSEYALRGKTILQKLTDNNPEVRPMVWGLATSSPAVALLIPETAWSELSQEDRVSLTWYLESLIPSVRAHPDQYIEEFHGAPVYETFLTKIAGLCADCWVIGLGHPTGDVKNLLFDKLAVQGDSLWERAPPHRRGVKASAFRVALRASQK